MFSKNRGGKTPQIIHLFIGFSIIFTIHFGVLYPYFWKHPHDSSAISTIKCTTQYIVFWRCHGSGDLHRQLPPGKRPQSRPWTRQYKMLEWCLSVGWIWCRSLPQNIYLHSFYSHFLRETGDCLPLHSSSEKLQNAIGKACRSMQRSMFAPPLFVRLLP